jgi:hypothetical protein
MTTGSAPDCMGCMYYHSVNFDGLTCDAFPNRIPEDIIMGEKHHEIRKGQTGDYVYKKFTEEEWRKLNPEE